MRHLFLFFITSVFFCSVQAQDTYKVGNTEYYSGQYYSTTGQPKVKRSSTNKKKFLKNLGYHSVPDGYEVDHIIPLSQGGTDSPLNMQLLTIEQHDRKTARERGRVANSTFSAPSFDYHLPSYDHSAPSYDYELLDIDYDLPSLDIEQPSFNYSTPTFNSGSSMKMIQTGPRGGKYYINSNGNKTYVD